MDPALFQRLAEEMGAAPDRMRSLHQGTFEDAVRGLEDLKCEARASYRRLAFKYHPDRNQGDAQAEIAFKALAEVLRQIEALQVKRSPVMIHAQVFRRGTPFSSNAATTTVVYDARKVVFVRP